ncbi:MAG: hypothetical protein LBR19_07450 [Bifidobacteriaceae bacterium]|jgi:tetratricopeptide (TPR) repeat protein|nr:hypothetical protein [Bifidobacteriaceae bacterium]
MEPADSTTGSGLGQDRIRDDVAGSDQSSEDSPHDGQPRDDAGQASGEPFHQDGHQDREDHPRERGDRGERGYGARPYNQRHGRGAGGRGGGTSGRAAEERQREEWKAQARAREESRMRPKNRLGAEEAPPLPDHVVPEDLPEPIRDQLAGLGKENERLVARHLVMVLETLEEAPEVAYLHARAAADRAARVTVVREYAALASYYSGRWTEAVREIRTFQRLSGTKAYPQLLADALRGVGKPLEAIELIQKTNLTDLDESDRLELTLVQAGARADLGEFDAALALLSKAARLPQPEGGHERLAIASERIEALKQGARPEDQEWMEEAP